MATSIQNRAVEASQLLIKIERILTDAKARVNRAGNMLPPTTSNLFLRVDPICAEAQALVQTKKGEIRADGTLSRSWPRLKELLVEAMAISLAVNQRITLAKEKFKQLIAPPERKPGCLVPSRSRQIPGLKPIPVDFWPLNGHEVRRPETGRMRTAYFKAYAADVTADKVSPPRLDAWDTIIDSSPGFAHQMLARWFGKVEENRVLIPHMVLESGGLESVDWLERVLDEGLVDTTGTHWMVVAVSASGMRQGKLFLWPKELAAKAFRLLAGKWLSVWEGRKVVPAKAVSHLANAFTSLVDVLDGHKVFADAMIRVVPDLVVKRDDVLAVRHGRDQLRTAHSETVTDGLVAVGSTIMRQIEAAMGYPEGSLHAVQIRGDLGTAIKGLLVEYLEIDPQAVLVFESAAKSTNDPATVARMLYEGQLGIVRTNRMPDNLTGLTTLSKQVLGLLPRRSLNAMLMARSIAEAVAKHSTAPDTARMLVGITEAEWEGYLSDAVEDAGKDGNIKKAVLAANAELALQDRSVRRFVADMLTDKVRRQALFGNLIVQGYDVWQAPDPLAVKIAELGLAKGPLTIDQLKKLAKKLKMRYLEPNEVLWGGCPDELNECEVALIRHPLQHPAQFALSYLIKAEDDPRWGVFFLPASGWYQSVMGGSDFDGDEVKIVVDEAVIDAIDQAKQGLDYIILPPDSTAEKVQLTEEGFPVLLREVLHRALRAVGQIGILSNQASAVSALVYSDAQRNLLLGVLAYLVMVAVDAVKTGVFPDPAKYLTEHDLAGTPLEFSMDGRLRIRREMTNGKEIVHRPVWLGQQADLRVEMARRDRTEMADLFMSSGDLVSLITSGRKDSNDKRVAEQLLRVARTIVQEPDDLRMLASSVVMLLPETAREEALDRLEALRHERMEAELNLDRANVRRLNRLIADQKRHLSALMAVSVTKARRILDSMGPERARALAAVIYSIRPAAAWSFCGPELVDLFLGAKDQPWILMELQPTGGSIKVTGTHLNDLTPEDAVALVRKTGTIRVEAVSHKGGIVHRVYVADQCIGQASSEFERYAQQLAQLPSVPVNTRLCAVEGRQLVIRLDPPQVGDGQALWLEQALQRIDAAWTLPVLDSTRANLLKEYHLLHQPSVAISQQVRQALDYQRLTLQWAAVLDACRSAEQLQAVSGQIKVAGLPESILAQLRVRYHAAMGVLTYGPAPDFEWQ